ncbi:O-antigen ligase family protein [Heyndrickxia coagulans]|uniref:O-antigen ligase family protein n=1 Tax=Heyndrickxia coagulans TaxID=1398 RepID=UPI002164BA3F|nr:O-antigen ligase family protein [Heyndrickxia coagulans]
MSFIEGVHFLLMLRLKKDIIIKSFYCFLILLPFVDFFNGVVMLSLNIQIVGIAYRALFFLFMILSILIYFKVNQSILVVYSITALLFSLLFLQTAINGDINYLFNDVSTLLKLLLSVFIIEFSKKFIVGKQENYINRIVFLYSVFFPILLLIPYFLGMGNSTYNNGGGFKGFFTATNDITVVFIFLNIYMGDLFFKSFNKKQSYLKNGLVYLLNIACLILIGTKTGIIFCLLWFLFLFFKEVILNIKITLISRLKILFVSVFSLVFIVFIILRFFSVPLLNTYNRVLYFYNLYSNNFVQFLTSSRSVFFESALYFSKHTENPFLKFIIGNGFKYREEKWGIGGLIEMDLADTFFSIGIIGLVIVLLYYFKFIVLSIKSLNSNIFSVSFLVMFLYSVFAGHVLYSALSSTLLGIACTSLLKNSKE